MNLVGVAVGKNTSIVIYNNIRRGRAVKVTIRSIAAINA